MFSWFCLFIYSFIPSCEEEPEVVHVFEPASSPPPLHRRFNPLRPSQPQNRLCKKPAPKPTPPKPKPVVKKSTNPRPSQLQTSRYSTAAQKDFLRSIPVNSTICPHQSQRLSNLPLSRLKSRSTPTISNSLPSR